jgi:hypothetical protein
MSHKHRLFLGATVALTVAAFLILAAPVRAQVATLATISGTVTDATGAVVPKASVTVIDEATGVRTTRETNNDGSYIVAGLVVGTYTVTVTQQGFETSTETGIILHPAITTSVNMVLKLGAVATQVTVSASAAQIQTTTHELSSQVSEQQVVTLPLNGRNYQSLSALMPGVTNLASGTSLNQGGFLQGNVMSINGMGESGTFYTLDGMWNMNTGNMTATTITPNPDTVEEVRTLTNNYGVQYSLMGANVVVLETKSGTDSFHGSGFEYFRNDALDARNFFSPTVPSLKQNIFGYTLGGPIYIPNHFNTNKQRMFFFWSQQWVYQNIASAVVGPTPTVAERSGDFSVLCPAGFNSSGICSSTAPGNTQLTNPVTGLPFPNNNIVTSATPLNASSLALANAQAPLPNYGAPGAFVNYINLNPEINRQRDDEIRVDTNFTDRMRLLAEYLDCRQTNKNAYDTLGFSTTTSQYGSPYSTSADIITVPLQLAQLQLTTAISSNMVNTLAVAMNNYVVNLPLIGITELAQVPTLANAQTLPFKGGAESDRLPEVDFSGGWVSLGTPHIFPLTHSADLEDTLYDDWSWLKGKHYIQGGMNIVLGTKRQFDYAASAGQWFFNGQFTGDAMADYLLGDAYSLTQVSTETRPYVHYKLASPYIQDRWKVNRKLSVTAGLRIEYMPIPNGQPGYIGNFEPALYNPADAPIVNPNGTITPTPNYNPANGLVINGVNGVPLNFDNAHNWLWGPSIGFAYDVFGDGKTALRGGYGITYERVPTAMDNSYYGGNNPPRVGSETLVSPSFPNAVGAAAAPPGTPTVLAEDPHEYPAGMIQTYSLSLEHQFAGNWFASIAGAGNIGHHVGTTWDINQALPDSPYDFNPLINTGAYEYQYGPYPGYAAIGQTNTNANLYWNGLEINVRHPVGRNLFLSVAYTYQHGLSDTRGLISFGCQGCTTMVQDTYHPRSNYGTSNFNVPQVLSVSYIWAIPWYQGAHGVKGAALGGWKYSGIMTLESGLALDPGLSTTNPGLATRPDRVSGTSIGGPKTVAEWFNRAAFSTPAYGYFGNAGTGSIPGPGLFDFDMAFYKDFHVTERHAIEFRAELFNIFNHTNFSNVVTNLGAADDGEVTSAKDPRIVEFALRYQF